MDTLPCNVFLMSNDNAAAITITHMDESRHDVAPRSLAALVAKRQAVADALAPWCPAERYTSQVDYVWEILCPITLDLFAVTDRLGVRVERVDGRTFVSFRAV